MIGDRGKHLRWSPLGYSCALFKVTYVGLYIYMPIGCYIEGYASGRIFPMCHRSFLLNPASLALIRFTVSEKMPLLEDGPRNMALADILFTQSQN